MREQLIGRGALGTEMPSRDRRLGITLDRNQLIVLVIDELSAADRAVGTDRAGDLGVVVLGAQVARALTHGFRPGAVGAGANLGDQGPTGKQIIEHGSLLPRVRTPQSQMILVR